MEKIRKAAAFALRAHGVQRRRHTGAPYIEHLVEVARIVSAVSDDEDAVCAALLHDTLEDTPVLADELERDFGPAVRSMVEDSPTATRRRGEARTGRNARRWKRSAWAKHQRLCKPSRSPTSFPIPATSCERTPVSPAPTSRKTRSFSPGSRAPIRLCASRPRPSSLKGGANSGRVHGTLRQPEQQRFRTAFTPGHLLTTTAIGDTQEAPDIAMR